MFETGRRLIDVFQNEVRNLDRIDRIFVIEAPTGYGKSVGASVIAALNYLKGFSFNFIHVLPLRSIVEDIYMCKYMYALGENIDAESCGALPPNAFSKALEVMGLDKNDVAYQMGFDFMLKGIGRKEPTYDAKLVISTLDSFAYNFLRVPVTEIFREIKHYATPRARIFTSTIFLDEVHMLNRFEDELSERVISFLKILVEFSLATSTPLILSTATLWNAFRESIRRWSSGRAMFFAISNVDEKRDSVVFVRDREFEEFAKSVSWRTGIVEEFDVASKVMEHVGMGEKVLVVRDRISDAVDLYKKLDLSDDEKVLIHGRLCLKDRENAFKKIARAKVVVATPVVEAGVDWDFDVGFRDATNIPSLIQVFGRVCRHRRNCNATVYLIRGSSKKGVEIIEFVKTHKIINWRSPFNYIENGVEVRGYSEVLEISSVSINENPEVEKLFRALATPVALPSRYINAALWDMSYSLLKEPLTQYYVYGGQRISEAKNVFDVILGSFTYTLEILKQYRKCVEKSVCIIEKDGHVIIEELDSPSWSQLQRKCAELASRYRGSIVFSGYVLKEDCYSNGLGLV